MFSEALESCAFLEIREVIIAHSAKYDNGESFVSKKPFVHEDKNKIGGHRPPIFALCRLVHSNFYAVILIYADIYNIYRLRFLPIFRWNRNKFV